MDDKTKNIIQNHIDTNDVCLFMKGTPDAPQCGFSMAVSNMLKILEVNFKSVNVLEDQSIREGIKIFSDWPTIPQLYVKKEFVGKKPKTSYRVTHVGRTAFNEHLNALENLLEGR